MGLSRIDSGLYMAQGLLIEQAWSRVTDFQAEKPVTGI